MSGFGSPQILYANRLMFSAKIKVAAVAKNTIALGLLIQYDSKQTNVSPSRK